MAEGEEVRNDKILIEQLPSRGISSVVYTLKVPNVFTLAEYDNTTSELYSPTFEFVNSTLRFRIESGTKEGVKELYIYLETISFKKLKQLIFYEIEFLDGEDKDYVHDFDMWFLESVEDEKYLYKFTNENSSHDKRNVLTLTVHLIYVESTEREEVLMRTLTREVTEKVRDEKIVIHQLPKRGISSVVYTLKVPNVFILAEFDSKVSKLYSPKFEFMNITWRFEAESEMDEEYKGLAIKFKKLNFRKRKQRIFCEIVLIDRESYYYNACMGILGDHEDELNLLTFTNSDSPHDKGDVLTLTVHIIYVESTEKGDDQILMRRSVLSLRDDFKSMLLNGQDHNLTFIVSGKNFRAHQDVLRARSDVFRSMLTHDMLEKNKGVIDVPDIDTEAFEQLLFYIYTGKVETLNESIMFGLYYAADKYNLAVLKEECCEFIKKSLTNTNVCDALNLATKHSDEGLLNSAMNYFFSNVDDILLTVEWQLFMRDNLTVANELIIKSLKKIREAQAS